MLNNSRSLGLASLSSSNPKIEIDKSTGKKTLVLSASQLKKSLKSISQVNNDYRVYKKQEVRQCLVGKDPELAEAFDAKLGPLFEEFMNQFFLLLEEE